MRSPGHRIVRTVALVVATLATCLLAAGPGSAAEPQTSFAFSLSASGAANSKASFQIVSGLQGQNDVVQRKPVSTDPRSFVQLVPGRVKWGEITLKQGIATDLALWKWREMVILGRLDMARAAATVTMYDRNRKPVMTWTLRNAWPSKISGPRLGGRAGQFAVDELVLQHEGMARA